MAIKVTLKKVEAEIDLADLDLPSVVFIDPACLIETLETSAKGHAKNAESAGSDYLRGYHEGASERMKMLAQAIKMKVEDKNHILTAHGVRGQAVRVHSITTIL